MRSAFTLIEVTLAIALSALIIVMAASAFRMVSRSISTMNRLSTENGLMRSAYLMACDDADYWHTAANPRYPHMKGFMSEGGRPFERVNMLMRDPARDVGVLPGSNDRANPNDLHPNDRRSWYRNFLVHNLRPFQVYKFTNSTTLLETGVYGEFWVSSNHPSTANSDTLPAGWSGRNVYGDYAEVGAVQPDMTLGHQATPMAASELHERGYRSVLHYSLFEKLGQLGPATYMPPGTPNIVLNGNRNQQTTSLGVLANMQSLWGEIPGALQLSGTVDARRNYYYGMPTSIGGDNDPDSWQTSNIPPNEGEWGNHLDKTVSCSPYLLDLDVATTRQGNRGRYRNSLMFSSKMRPLDYTGTNWDAEYVDQSSGQPFLILSRIVTGGDDWISNIQMRRFMNNAWVMPFGITDAPSPGRGDLPDEIPSLSYHIMRYRHMSADRNLVQIRLRDPTTGRMTEFAFNLSATTYRGARQHWGWKSRWDDTSLKPMGDIYER